METTFRSPLVDLFRRGEVSADVRLLAARGALAPRAHEQLALLVLLHDDRDAEVAAAARRTVDGLPGPALAAFLARPDVSMEVRSFFAARGVVPDASHAVDASAPLLENEEGAPPEIDLVEQGATGGAGVRGTDAERRRQLSTLTIPERIKVAMRGSREQRAVLVRDPNRLVALAVLSSPKLSGSEVEGFARMANVSDDVLRIIGTNRAWTKNYAVVAALARNPKTPPAVSLSLTGRLNERDLKLLAVDRNIPEGLRAAARKAVAAGSARRK